jgi:hypothetical protein
LVLGSKKQTEKARTVTGQLKREMFDGLVDSLKKQIKTQVENKNRKLEESATHGASPPLSLTNEIIGIDQSIEELKGKLRDLMELQDD